jgi:uncharacterized protein (UPF0335 family)
MTMAKGTASGKMLRGFIEEIEGIRERKKQLGEAEKAVFAEAKAKDLDVKTIRRVLQIRQMKPGDHKDAETLLDTYMHAIGMAEESPLWAAFGKFSVDLAQREEAIEFLKSIVPPTGEIVLKLGGTPVRVFRDNDGKPQAEEVVAEPAPSVRRSRLTSTAADDDDEDVYTGGTPRTVPKSHVQTVVERAEARAAAQREREEAR